MQDFHEQFSGIQTAKLQTQFQGEMLDLHIFVDRSSVEVFANHGQAVITDLIFPDGDSVGISLATDNERLLLASMSVYSLTTSV
ncbi:Levanase precursor [compost metagenome]